MRLRVFCTEQGVSREGELDGLDETAVHLVAVDGDELIATCRLLFDDSVCRLGRMAVDRGHRRAGLGRELLDAAEAEAARRGAGGVVLDAQRRAEGFYAAAGYVAEGGTFMEEGIPHVRMRKELGR